MRIHGFFAAEYLFKLDHSPRMTLFRHFILIGCLLSFLVGGCSKQPAPPGAPVLKVAIFSDGRLTVDGESVTFDEFRVALRSLSEKGGVVWYYREAGQQEPPAIVLDVMKAILETGCPSRFSSRPDYSDSIGRDGKPITK